MTRARFRPGMPQLALPALLVLVALAMACGSGDPTETATSTSESSTTSTPGSSTSTPDASTGETREVEDYFGTVTLPMTPTRVVAGDSVTLGNIIALGVKPIAAGVNVNSLPGYLSDQMEGVEVVTTADGSGINLERVAELDPEVIITFAGFPDDAWNKEDCDLFATVATTFCYVYGYAYEDEIKTNLTETARALNLEEKAAEVIADYDARIEELRQRVAATNLDEQTVSVLRVAQESYSLRFGTTENIIFKDIGLQLPPNQQNPDDFRIEVSLENLDIVDSDILFVYVDDNAQDQLAPLTDNPLYATLPAVQNGNVFFVNSGVWNSADIIGAMEVMDDIESTLIEPAEQGS